MAYGRQIRERVQQWTGLTVGVGIGPTKTLAKLANYAAKKWPATGGVVDLRDETRRAKLMAITPVDEVWGIGRKLTTKLSAQGVIPPFFGALKSRGHAACAKRCFGV